MTFKTLLEPSQDDRACLIDHHRQLICLILVQALAGLAAQNPELEVKTCKCLDKCKQGPSFESAQTRKDPHFAPQEKSHQKNRNL